MNHFGTRLKHVSASSKAKCDHINASVDLDQNLRELKPGVTLAVYELAIGFTRACKIEFNEQFKNKIIQECSLRPFLHVLVKTISSI